MPTRKQRRREQKNRRHEWEYVYVDDEGHEVEVEEDEAGPVKTAKGTRPPKQIAGRSPARQAAKPSARSAARKIDPPSWQRVFRRAAIFAPIMAIVVYYLQRNHNPTILTVAFNVLVLLIFFVPFSYFIDVMMYRAYRKRIGDPIPPRERKSRKG